MKSTRISIRAGLCELRLCYLWQCSFWVYRSCVSTAIQKKVAFCDLRLCCLCWCSFWVCRYYISRAIQTWVALYVLRVCCLRWCSYRNSWHSVSGATQNSIILWVNLGSCFCAKILNKISIIVHFISKSLTSFFPPVESQVVVFKADYNFISIYQY
jgi:hypothetical protein